MSVPYLVKISALSFLIIMIVRRLFLKKKIYLFLYYISLFVFIFMVGAVGGGGIINDAYDRLEDFRKLEESNQLEYAKSNPEIYNSMLQIDLEQFKDSNEFEEYIKKEYEPSTDRAEAISVGLFFAFLSEVALLFSMIIQFIFHKAYRKNLRTKAENFTMMSS